MAFTLEQTPAQIDACYGPTIFTLNYPEMSEAFFVMEVWDGFPAVGNSVRLATLHQSPNAEKAAIFDIQSILQSYVSVSKDDADRLGNYNAVSGPQPFGAEQPKILSGAANESTTYYIRTGVTEATGTDPSTWQLSAGPYQVFSGVKPWWNRQFDKNDQGLPEDRFTAEVVGNTVGTSNCSYVEDLAQPLSDNRDRLFIDDCGYAYPQAITDNVVIARHYVTSDDYKTKSWINSVRRGVSAPATFVKGIDAFYVVVYNGSNELGNPIIPNTVINGGGPNTTFKEGLTLAYPNYFTTIGTGPANLKEVFFTRTDDSSSIFEIDDTPWTHYWIYPVVGQVDTPSTNTCGQTIEGANVYPLGEPQLYIKKELDCLDYEPIQISWLNRFGFRDQFTFRAKNTKKITTTRNTYKTPNYNPNAAEWVSDPEFRGETTYSTSNVVEFTANTAYITDEQAATLETLFSSPDVRADIPYSLLNDQPGYLNASFEAVTITNKSYTLKTYRKDKLFQYEIKFRLSNNPQSQQG
tara:strand:+ start:74 stop:1639 length:1566 start_codon:yes stop_codon:yes gene_type:complete